MPERISDERLHELREQHTRGQQSVDDIQTADVAELLHELEFLRYFYDNAGEAMGPASDDCYYYIKEGYVENGGVLPVGYRSEDWE